MTVKCDCGEKQYLIFNENGILMCLNCGTEQTT